MFDTILNKSLYTSILLSLCALEYGYTMENPKSGTSSPQSEGQSTANIIRSESPVKETGYNLVNFQEMLACSPIVSSRFQKLNDDIQLDLKTALQNIQLIAQEMIKSAPSAQTFSDRMRPKPATSVDFDQLADFMITPNQIVIYDFPCTPTNEDTYTKIITKIQTIRYSIEAALKRLKAGELTAELYCAYVVTIAQISTELIAYITHFIEAKGTVMKTFDPYQLACIRKHIEALAKISTKFQNIHILLDEYKTISEKRPAGCTDAQALSWYRGMQSPRQQELARRAIGTWRTYKRPESPELSTHIISFDQVLQNAIENSEPITLMRATTPPLTEGKSPSPVMDNMGSSPTTVNDERKEFQVAASESR